MNNANKGYVGFSMSVRAVEAYKCGELPKTQFKKHYGISEKIFKKMLEVSENEYEFIGMVEHSWHHTSKFFNKTDFYKLNIEGLLWLSDYSVQAKFEYDNEIGNYVEKYWNEKEPKIIAIVTPKKSQCTDWNIIKGHLGNLNNKNQKFAPNQETADFLQQIVKAFQI